MRNLILASATALMVASPTMAAELSETTYRESYTRSSYTRSSYEHRPAARVVVEEAPRVVVKESPRVVVKEAAPVVSETVVVRRPVIVEPAPVVLEEDYPVYAAPRLVAAPRVFAYAGPGRRGGWGYRHHFHGGW